MNLNCTTCGGLFTPTDTDLCAGCNRPSHKRPPCGSYEPVYREGDIYVYFFCSPCNAAVPELDWSE